MVEGDCAKWPMVGFPSLFALYFTLKYKGISFTQRVGKILTSELCAGECFLKFLFIAEDTASSMSPTILSSFIVVSENK